jgi:AraC family transcriptional regulator
MATALSVHLLRHYTASKGPPVVETTDTLSCREMRRAAEYVEDNIARNPSLMELAQEAGMGRYRFSRLFKQSTGLSPHQYVIARRVEKAKQLLGLEGYSLHEVALSTGFSDQAHLTRHFKRLVGTTPGEFRRRVKNVQ